MIEKIIHPAGTRGYAHHGWLDTHHTFSFGSYHNRDRMNFGALRVLNDDVIQGGHGFGLHGHKNMEIISIPLEGALAHDDNRGHTGVIRPHDVQVMSAGTGIMHTEHNYSTYEPVHFLQLWVLPESQELSPRYAQYSFDSRTWEDQFAVLVTSQQRQGRLWIHQQVVIARANLSTDSVVRYKLHNPGHGVYIFVIAGKVDVAGEILSARDGMGLRGASTLTFQGVEPCELLLIEVPMYDPL